MRNTKYVLITTAFLLLFGQFGFGQTYAVPRELKIERHVRQSFPKYFGRNVRYPQLTPQAFYPIGWSKDGKFAYYYEPVDEACGCYFANLVIQDMRTDKVVWEFEFNQDKLADEKGNMPPEDNIRKLWNKNRKLFSEKLAENNIIASRFNLLGPSFTAGGNGYTAKTSVRIGPDADDVRVTSFEVMLFSPRLGAKKLHTVDYTKDEYLNTLDARIIGVLKSPYENRVAVVTIEVGRGWEGPPHNGNIVVAGADLMSGFVKK
jgi:hypothetical protein